MIFDKVMLERMRYSWKMEISHHLIMNLNEVQLTEYVERTLRNAIYKLDVDIFGQKLDRIMWKMPANWKEAIKERFFPKWLLKIYPVKYTEFKIDPVVLYPQIQIPNEKHYFRYERVVEDNG